MEFPNREREQSTQASQSMRTRIKLRKSGRFFPPHAEEDEAAADGEQDADDDAVCRSIRPTMSRGETRRRPTDQPPSPTEAVTRRLRGRVGRTKSTGSPSPARTRNSRAHGRGRGRGGREGDLFMQAATAAVACDGLGFVVPGCLP